jgi:hypothetical protein
MSSGSDVKTVCEMDFGAISLLKNELFKYVD